MTNRVSREVTREREMRAWGYRQQGWTEQHIADELGIDFTTVSKMLKRMDERFLKTQFAEVERLKAIQTSQLEHIYREALTRWEKSCEELTIETITSGRAEVTKSGELVTLPDEIKIEHRQQNGDPRMLDQARGALGDIRKIWGADAPTKVDLTQYVQTIAAELGIEPAEAVKEAERILAVTR